MTNDLIRRSDVVSVLLEAISKGENWYSVIKDIPTVDAVEVVRCKDCLFSYYKKESGVYFCHRFNDGRRTSRDKYCSYGEER